MPTGPACVMMQQDEDDLLAPWLAYHGYLFGFENLYVFDNGSTHSVTLDIIRRFQGAGVKFDFSYCEDADYEKKGEIVRSKINELDAGGRHNAYFPLDCDEFLVALGNKGLSCARGEVLTQIDRLVKKRGVLIIPSLLYNIPGEPTAFYFQDQQKVCFSGGGVSHLDHGNHNGGMPGTDAPCLGNALSYLHFHNRSFVAVRNHALQKLKNRVDVSDKQRLLSYKGHGDHLIRYFSMNEREYVNSFASLDIVMFPAFISLLAALGVDSDIMRATYSPISVERTGTLFTAEFDGDAYWRANPDVAARQTPALFHYYRHGKREKRRLR